MMTPKAHASTACWQPSSTGKTTKPALDRWHNLSMPMEMVALPSTSADFQLHAEGLAGSVQMTRISDPSSTAPAAVRSCTPRSYRSSNCSSSSAVAIVEGFCSTSTDSNSISISSSAVASHQSISKASDGSSNSAVASTACRSSTSALLDRSSLTFDAPLESELVPPTLAPWTALTWCSVCSCPGVPSCTHTERCCLSPSACPRRGQGLQPADRTLSSQQQGAASLPASWGRPAIRNQAAAQKSLHHLEPGLRGQLRSDRQHHAPGMTSQHHADAAAAQKLMHYSELKLCTLYRQHKHEQQGVGDEADGRPSLFEQLSQQEVMHRAHLRQVPEGMQQMVERVDSELRCRRMEEQERKLKEAERKFVNASQRLAKERQQLAKKQDLLTRGQLKLAEDPHKLAKDALEMQQTIFLGKLVASKMQVEGPQWLE